MTGTRLLFSLSLTFFQARQQVMPYLLKIYKLCSPFNLNFNYYNSSYLRFLASEQLCCIPQPPHPPVSHPSVTVSSATAATDEALLEYAGGPRVSWWNWLKDNKFALVFPSVTHNISGTLNGLTHSFLFIPLQGSSSVLLSRCSMSPQRRLHAARPEWETGSNDSQLYPWKNNVFSVFLWNKLTHGDQGRWSAASHGSDSDRFSRVDASHCSCIAAPRMTLIGPVGGHLLHALNKKSYLSMIGPDGVGWMGAVDVGGCLLLSPPAALIRRLHCSSCISRMEIIHASWH